MGLEGRRVLFISYNGMLDPLGQTQVLPYLRELAKLGVHYTLLSFEREKAFTPEGATRRDLLRRSLADDGIEWHWLRYHQTPSVPATAYDVIAGVRYASKLVRRNGVEMVHARSHIPATIALALKRRHGVKMIFDVRGLMAEEYVDAEHWRKGSVPYRITKTVERRAFAAADGIVTLTERIWPILREWDGIKGRNLIHTVIPCCVDLELFKNTGAEREETRAKLGLDDRFTLIYSGSLDGWYLTEHMADFFAEFLKRKPAANVLWLTTGSHARVKELMTARNIPSENYSVHSAFASEVPRYLAAADVGVAFIKPCLSKLASSPTKYGEYLACGLPLLINAGVGDSDALVEQFHVGTLVREFDAANYLKAAVEVEQLASQPDVRKRNREVAYQLFDLRTVGAKRYAELYERVFSQTNS
jgi:glycosyltransferase involved in cell wall biosynthesis